MNIIGQAIDPTRIDQELVDGKLYWQMVPDVEYSIEGNKRKGALLVAPALGFERSIVRTPEGKDFEMSPAYYSAEILLDSSYRMLTLRFYRIEVAQEQNNVRRRLVDAVPSPIIEDFLPRVKRLMEGKIRVVKPGPAGFDVMAAESAKSKAKKEPKKKAAPKKKTATKKTTAGKPAASKKKATTRKATVKKAAKPSSKNKPVKGKKR